MVIDSSIRGCIDKEKVLTQSTVKFLSNTLISNFKSGKIKLFGEIWNSDVPDLRKNSQNCRNPKKLVHELLLYFHCLTPHTHTFKSNLKFWGSNQVLITVRAFVTSWKLWICYYPAKLYFIWNSNYYHQWYLYYPANLYEILIVVTLDLFLLVKQFLWSVWFRGLLRLRWISAHIFFCS